MKNTRRILLAAAALVALPLIHGCATKIKASSSHNPAPATAFSSYGRIDVKPVAYAPGYKGNPAALGKIAANLDKDLAPSLAQWNSRPDNGRTLTVEPIVEEMSFKSTTKRVFLGPLAGSSGVLMRVTFRDNTGKVIATPEFFQRANAMSGGFTLGVQDNLMLTRVSRLASSYVIANYDQAVGGPTGADDAAVN
ncbi:hypothetical protein [Massilia brevitalea]|uniref:hypothetical protein n=1 Tax=Massilia brevitalea TaxID=442526 RepID=UPI002739580F|nr:hypothetical protein [Massilia brevitalea]